MQATEKIGPEIVIYPGATNTKKFALVLDGVTQDFSDVSEAIFQIRRTPQSSSVLFEATLEDGLEVLDEKVILTIPPTESTDIERGYWWYGFEIILTDGFIPPYPVGRCYVGPEVAR